MFAFPQLRRVSIAELDGIKSRPRPVIKTDSDMEAFKKTDAYSDYALFLHRLNESVVGHFLPWSGGAPSESINRTLQLFDTLDRWIDDTPPQPTPQRFGNLAFRTWGKKLEENVDNLLTSLLSPEFVAAVPFVREYLLTSFGSFTRMDYGTGHEVSFALFLLCLSILRFYQTTPAEERALVLLVFVRYSQLCWKLQDTYKLEPAGSHGVWGLDDSSFLGYIFGSDQNDIPVSAILNPPLPSSNLYFMLINRIHQVKHGPFHEHSSQLHSIAVGVPTWGKVNSGLFKMYEAEVLGKRVVVQHIPLGGLLQWNPDHSSAATSGSPQQMSITTQAPWTATLHPSVPKNQTADTPSSTVQTTRNTAAVSTEKNQGYQGSFKLPL